jgi:hypothetical protein
MTGASAPFGDWCKVRILAFADIRGVLAAWMKTAAIWHIRRIGWVTLQPNALIPTQTYIRKRW